MPTRRLLPPSYHCYPCSPLFNRLPSPRPFLYLPFVILQKALHRLPRVCSARPWLRLQFAIPAAIALLGCFLIILHLLVVTMINLN